LKRTKLKDRVLPDYTKGEEIFNMVSHIVGGALGVTATALCVVFAALHRNVYGVVASAIYGASLIVLYTMSSVYHGLRTDTSKKVMQVLDHCTIYFLIAGTYTPYTLCTLREDSPGWGWALFGVVWGFAVLGIVFNAIDLKKYKIFSMIVYIGMGWCIVIRIHKLPELLGFWGFMFLLIGGILYTIGAVLYGVGKKVRYMHSVFHLFVLAGSLMHFFGIFFYVI